ncbi:MAG: hypothetical protein V3V79_03575, partial [Gammaproteobacteria bacterium]
MNARNRFSAVFGALWRVLGKLARAVKVLILFMFFLFLVTSLFGGRIQVPESAALIVDPAGILVDQLEGDPLERALAELQDSPT